MAASIAGVFDAMADGIKTQGADLVKSVSDKLYEMVIRLRTQTAALQLGCRSRGSFCTTSTVNSGLLI